MEATDDWLLKSEPDLYKQHTGKDPYSIWVTKLVGLEVVRRAARLLAFTDDEYTKAAVIYLDGTRDEIFKEQMSGRD